MTKEIKTIRQKVESLLSESERCREDDKLLQLTYWLKYDNISFDDFASEFILKATPAESITRARRIIQAEGRFLPPDEVLMARKGREARMVSSILLKREVI